MVCLAFIGEGLGNWVRELCCHSAAGYSKVGTLDSIEEEDEEELGEIRQSREDSGMTKAMKVAPQDAAANGHANGHANGRHALQPAQPASVRGGR